METLVLWTKSLCIELSQDHLPSDGNNMKVDPEGDKFLPAWSVLDLGTGNGLFLQELAKHGYPFRTETSLYLSSSSMP